jgi:hypothetical protein
VIGQSGDVGQDDGIVSGQAQSSQLVLSMTGACPYYDSVHRTLPREIAGSELSAHVVANIRYTYNLQALRKYTAKYNLGAFVRKLQQSESHGGLFSTKTINRLIEDEHTNDWFQITTYSEDGRETFDPQFAQTIKAEMIDRALKNIALLVTGEPVAAPQLSQPKANGASVASGELRKCPYLYCQVGAAVLDVANAIFGKSTSVAEYIHTHDTWVTETESDFNMLPFEGTLTFTPRKN